MFTLKRLNLETGEFEFVAQSSSLQYIYQIMIDSSAEVFRVESTKGHQDFDSNGIGQQPTKR